MFERFDSIRIINLASRGDRRRQMRHELRRVGLAQDCRVAFINAVRPDKAQPWRKIGERCCFLSHLSILEAAFADRYSVLILEDDADFTAASAQPPPSVDVLWGGHTCQPGWIEHAHCMGFSAKAVARLVPFLRDLKQQPSPPPIDGAYVDFLQANSDLTVHFCNPAVALQRPSVSDIAGAHRIDTLPLARPFVAVLRQVKREWQRRYRRS